MAKSLRAKSKQENRRKKRNDENSYYKAVSAARVQKVSDRLLGKDKEPEVEGGDLEMEGDAVTAEDGEGESGRLSRSTNGWAIGIEVLCGSEIPTLHVFGA